MKKQVKLTIVSCLFVSLLLFMSLRTPTYAETLDVASCNLVHNHSGSNDSGGGCYGNRVDTTHQEYWDGICKICGEGPLAHNPGCISSDHSFVPRGWVTIPGYEYTINCGLSDNAVIGVVSVKKTREGATYELVPSCSSSSSKLSNVTYTWSNGNVGTCTVTGNGEYLCTVSYNDNGTTRSTSCSYTVEDYDNEPPVINRLAWSEEGRTNKDVKISVEATDNIQLGGYSLNDGAVQDSNEFTFDSNQSGYFRAIDAVGNVSVPYVFTVDFIDKEPPVVESIAK